VRACVVGAGAIGSLFAAHLATIDEVVVLTRRDDHARALNREGLRVSGRHDFTARVTAAADPCDLPDFDVGIVATKATGLEDAAEALAGRFPGATMMTVQNGLGAEEAMRRHGQWQLVSAVTFMSGTKHSDTHVEYILDTPTWLGPYGDTPFERVQEIAQGKNIVRPHIAQALVEAGVVETIELSEGDRILYQKYTGQEITVDKQDYIVIRFQDVLARLEDDANGNGAAPRSRARR
jgi:2-dehydropantoate 2-reductase